MALILCYFDSEVWDYMWWFSCWLLVKQGTLSPILEGSLIMPKYSVPLLTYIFIMLTCWMNLDTIVLNCLNQWSPNQPESYKSPTPPLVREPLTALLFISCWLPYYSVEITNFMAVICIEEWDFAESPGQRGQNLLSSDLSWGWYTTPSSIILWVFLGLINSRFLFIDAGRIGGWLVSITESKDKAPSSSATEGNPRLFRCILRNIWPRFRKRF